MVTRRTRIFLAAGIVIAITLAGYAATYAPVYAQDAPGPQAGDPPRWYQPNVTDADRYRTAMKEAGAAQQEALNECRSKAAPERDACVREARARYRSDVDTAKALVGGRTITGKAPQ